MFVKKFLHLYSGYYDFIQILRQRHLLSMQCLRCGGQNQSVIASQSALESHPVERKQYYYHGNDSPHIKTEISQIFQQHTYIYNLHYCISNYRTDKYTCINKTFAKNIFFHNVGQTFCYSLCTCYPSNLTYGPL